MNASIQSLKETASTTDLTSYEDEVNKYKLIQFVASSSYQSAAKQYRDAITTKKTAESEKTKANTEIRNYSQQLFNQYGNRINQLLSEMAANCRIANPKVTFKGGLPSGQLDLILENTIIDTSENAAKDRTQKSLRNTLSAGERSSLALAFFLAIAEQDADRQNLILVFDDPYFSQDDGRRRQTINLISRLANRVEQTFVFSHDISFAHDIVSSRPGVDARGFKLVRDGSPTSCTLRIKAEDLDNGFVHDHKERVQQFLNYRKAPEDNANEMSRLRGELRRLLEGYIVYKYPTKFGALEWLGDFNAKIKAAADSDELAPMKSHLQNLTEVAQYSNPTHHRNSGTDSDVTTPSELCVFIDKALTVLWG